MPGLDRTARILLPPHRVLDVDIAPRARCPHHIRGGVAAAAMDEDEIVDNLRAEIASTRSLIQQTKAGMVANKK